MSEYGSESEYSDSSAVQVSFYDDYADLTPLPLPKQVPGFFEMHYTDDYKELMGYFFALYVKREYSERALRMCDRVLSRFQLNYTAWSYKMLILEHIGYDYKKVQADVEYIINQDSKIFQAWQFYRWLSERHEFDAFPLMRDVLKYEPKNFHAWSYIVWYARKYNKADELYNLCLEQIDLDARNNSAWSSRMVAMDMKNLDPESEFDSAAESLRKIPRNEAARNYLYGLCDKNPQLIPKLDQLGEELCEKNPDNFNAYRLLLYKASVDHNTEKIGELCDQLIRVDPIRTNYYNLLKAGKIQYM